MSKSAPLPPDLNTIGGRLRWAREMRGYASARAAARMNRWSENTYKSHENGIRRKDNLPEDAAKKYAKAFNISRAWLLTGLGDPLKPDRPDDVSPEELNAAIELVRASRKHAS
jgi:hypothetical protein